MATSDEPATVAIDTRERAGSTTVRRAVPQYIAPAEPEDEAPIYPGSTELDDDAGGDSDAAADSDAPGPRRRSPLGPDLAALVLRWALGAFLIVRGTQELFGWFGGQGGVTLASQLQRLGYQSFATEATAVAVAELVIGGLLVLGLLTEWACGGLLALSVVAVLAQHRMGSGLLAHPGTGLGATVPGLELVGGLGILAVVLALLGAGRLSLDRNRFWARAPLVTAVLALVIGAAVGAVLIQPQLA
ncbi:MAG: DoxX family protein [Actinomycetota bacterium]|nr:DoxX family protein [Actinomycetota bacterium]